MDKNNNWSLKEKCFGPLWPYIIDDKITDIDWDSDSLWIKYADGKIEKSDIEINETFLNDFAQYVANHESREFNETKNILTAETDTLRITVVHESFATSGSCFSIRKSLPKLRFSASEAVNSGYCPKEILAFLVNSVKGLMNFAFAGEPGAGKTECAKFCSSFIPAEQKVITIEDVLEWHYGDIIPGKRHIELKVGEDENYTDAIKTSLRLNPKWLMLSEVRSMEVKFLLESWSTGVRGMTTLHTDDVRNIPDRIENMSQDRKDKGNIRNNVFTYLDIGVLLAETSDKNGKRMRKIKQVCMFYRENRENKIHMVMDDFELTGKEFPESVLKMYRMQGINDVFHSEELEERIRMEETCMENRPGTEVAGNE